MSIEDDILAQMHDSPEVTAALDNLAQEVCDHAKSIAPVFGETGRDERRQQPPNDEPGAYRDSIHVESVNDQTRRVISKDYKALWIELGSRHMPEYAVFAKTAVAFGGSGPDFAQGIEKAQSDLHGEVQKLNQMVADGAPAHEIHNQRQAVDRARNSRSAAFKAARSRRGRRH